MVQDNPKFKEILTLLLLALTMGWGVFAVLMTYKALCTLDQVSVLASAGADVILGSLITWTGLSIQYWIRKRPGDSDANEGGK